MGVGAAIAGAAIIGGVANMLGAEQASKSAASSAEWQAYQARQAAEMADPFRGERAQYQDMLKKLLANPESLLESPLYKSTVEAGSSQVERTMASRGLRMSGAEKLAISEQAGSDFEELFYKQASLLSGLSGANVNPASGASLYLQGTTAAESMNLAGQFRSQDLMSQGYAGILSGAVGLYGAYSAPAGGHVATDVASSAHSAGSAW